MCIDFYDSVYSGTISEPVILPKQMQTAVMRNHESRFINWNKENIKQIDVYYSYM